MLNSSEMNLERERNENICKYAFSVILNSVTSPNLFK